MLLELRSQRRTFPLESPLANQGESPLKAKVVAGHFCLTENTTWSFFRLRKAITPLVRATPTISTRNAASTTAISASFSVSHLLNRGNE